MNDSFNERTGGTIDGSFDNLFYSFEPARGQPLQNRHNNAIVTPLKNTFGRKSQKKLHGVSPTKSIYELVKQDIKMPEGLQFRGKYVAKTRNKLSNKGKSQGTLSDARSLAQSNISQRLNTNEEYGGHETSSMVVLPNDPMRQNYQQMVFFKKGNKNV